MRPNTEPGKTAVRTVGGNTISAINTIKTVILK